MADFTILPDFVIEETTEFDTKITKYERGSEQRASLRANAIRSWRLQFNNRTQDAFETVRDFFISKKGQATSFTWDNPIDSVTYVVRFMQDSLLYKLKAYQIYDFECIFKQIIAWTTTTTSTTSTSTSTTTTSTSTTTTSSTSTTSTSTTSTTSTSTTSTTSTSTTSTTSSTSTTSISTTSTTSTTTTL